jgi:hypothetical protein
MTVSSQDCFDPDATMAMGMAFDHACLSFHGDGTVLVRDVIAKRIIEAATAGERNSIRLYEYAVAAFAVEDASTAVLSEDRNHQNAFFAWVTAPT